MLRAGPIKPLILVTRSESRSGHAGAAAVRRREHRSFIPDRIAGLKILEFCHALQQFAVRQASVRHRGTGLSRGRTGFGSTSTAPAPVVRSPFGLPDVAPDSMARAATDWPSIAPTPRPCRISRRCAPVAPRWWISPLRLDPSARPQQAGRRTSGRAAVLAVVAGGLVVAGRLWLLVGRDVLRSCAGRPCGPIADQVVGHDRSCRRRPGRRRRRSAPRSRWCGRAGPP